MDIKVGEYKLVGSHKGCKYSGKLMKCTPQTVDGEVYPPYQKDEDGNDIVIDEWLWCNGKRWSVAHKEAFDPTSQDVRQWLYCGYSTRSKNDEVH